MFGRFSSGPLINEINQVSAGQIAEETVVSVGAARVVCANYRAIVHDFPQVFGPEALRENPLIGCDACAESNRLCPQAINAWLIRNSAFVSQQQVAPNEVNSPIEAGEVTRKAYRPPDYGRAVIVPVDTPGGPGEAGFLDLKGAGVAPGRVPSHEAYSSGLEYLGYAIADFFYAWLIDTIFARTFPGYNVVPVYAVLDLGFDIVGGWHGTAPAGMHVRRAHPRPIPRECHPRSGTDRERLMLHVELLLRAFGLSTTGSGTAFHLGKASDGEDLFQNGVQVETKTDLERDKAAQIREVIRASGGDCLEIINVQMASGGGWADKSLQFYDFGQVRGCRDFTNPFTNMILNGALNVGRIISPSDRSFVQPHRTIAVDPELCNRRSANAYGFYAAQAFRSVSNPFTQRRVETLLRIARLKAMRRNFDWAVDAVSASRARTKVSAAQECQSSASKITYQGAD